MAAGRSIWGNILQVAGEWANNVPSKDLAWQGFGLFKQETVIVIGLLVAMVCTQPGVVGLIMGFSEKVLRGRKEMQNAKCIHLVPKLCHYITEKINIIENASKLNPIFIISWY